MKRPLLTIFALITTALSGQAWGPQGHEIVDRIAELHLTPRTLQAVNQLLNGTNAPVTIHISDDDVANWPDHVRSRRPETAPWHFVDIPFRAERFDPARDCTEHKGCVVEAIRDNERLLVDREATDKERVEALKFLVHFVGDIHQPLHCAERNGDKGGNLCQVKWPDAPKPTKLHVVWDVNLVDKNLHDRALDKLAYADYLNRTLAGPNAKAWSGGTPADWAWESHQHAVTEVYYTVPANGLPELLSADYIRKGQALVDIQLTKAGLRLAELLNQALRSRE